MASGGLAGRGVGPRGALLGLALLVCRPAGGVSVEYPHAGGNDITCSACHVALGQVPFGFLPFTAINADDTPANDLCLSCHNDVEAPFVRTHSSLTTSARYGNWSMPCVTCHEPHQQPQSSIWTSQSYATTGTVLLAGPATIQQAGAGWTTDQWAGWTVIGNITHPELKYRIVSNTADTLTVVGPVDLAAISPGSAFAIVYGRLIRSSVSTPNSGVKAVKFFAPVGAHSFADGDATLDGICEVCHTQTTHFRNNDSGPDQHHANVGGATGLNCISCHSHRSGFAHGVGGTGPGCGSSSTCHGTQASHPTHVGGGAHLSLDCSACHDTNSFPRFKDGQDLAHTTACDPCHSPGGSYDGVNDPAIGAKNNWEQGVYDSGGATLRAGKDRWCATCHDESPSVITGVSAPNVIGDETGAYTYGTGWGYYETGHGLPNSSTYPASGGVTPGAGIGCDGCHDLSSVHIDGLARTFDDGSSSTLDPSDYRQGYRLKTVAAGQGTGSSTQEPMLVPWPGPRGNSANNYRLCVTCHDSGPFTDASDTNTNFRTMLSGTDPVVNRHEYHLGLTYQLRYSSDWDNAGGCNGSTSANCNSQINCVSCHNVHGSTRLAMVRDGKLEGREPALQIWYNNTAIVAPTNPPDPQNLPLTGSTGSIWIPGSSGNLCSHCHGGGGASIEDRTPYQTLQQTPALTWTGENGYINDGVNPDSGPGNGNFTFRVKYTDTNNDTATTYQVWVDANDDGAYGADEKFNMTSVDSVDGAYYDGKLYTYTTPLSKAGNNEFTYRFKFSDGTSDAVGEPASDRTVTVTNTAPRLSWTEEAYYHNAGVSPVAGGNNGTFTFRIKYADADNECPPAAVDIQVWIDANDNGIYEDGEKHNLTAADASPCSAGRTYAYSGTLTYAGDGIVMYTFRASDGFALASGDAGPLSNSLVTVLTSANIPSRLDWEAGACRTAGVSPPTGAAGADFAFLVKYTDFNNSCPASGSGDIQAWIDENDSGAYEESERHNLTEADPGDTDCTDGKLYTTARQLAYAGDGNIAYRFYASDGSNVALGDPADSDRTVSVVNGARKVRPAGGSGWYSTIQSAVAADQTILVYPSADFTPATYSESVLVNTSTHNVTIRSVCGPEYTIIAGAGAGYALRSNVSNNLTIDGVSLTGDTNGVYANGGSPITISNCRIHNNAGTGILAINGASLTISNCEIYSNAGPSVTWGGGVYLVQGTHTIDNSVIRNNTSAAGAGIATTNYAAVTVENTAIRDNTAATGNGGGIYVSSGTLNLSRSTISGNVSSAAAGGIYTNSSPTVGLDNCLLVNNRAADGGLLYVNSGTVAITNSTLADNQATAGNGGAIYTNNVAVTVRNSIFWNNLASASGHNLHKGGAPGPNPSTITDSDIFTGRFYISNTTPTLANNIAQDPFFTGAGDYHVQSHSPVIDRANAAYAPVGDIEGNPRPQGNGYDMGAYEFASAQQDTEVPVVTGFTATTPSSSSYLSITLFTASDNVGVTGYRITTSVVPPDANDEGWSATAPATHMMTSDGSHTLYPWAKDAAGNVSLAFATPRTVMVDANAPAVTAFTTTTPWLNLVIPIPAFAAADVVGVTGYQITTSAVPPFAGGGGWSGTAPATYTVGVDGTYTLYPWARDAIGNVSAVFATPRTVVVDTTHPTVSNTDPPPGATEVTANTPVTINWSEDVNCSTVNTTGITMSAGAWSLTTCSGNQAVFATGAQSASTTYTVTVTTSVHDSHGNPMASNHSFSYTTAAGSNNAPTLEWVTGYTCLSEGVRPRTGANEADFNFRVRYRDGLDGDCPDAEGVRVVVNGIAYTLTQNDGASCQGGREYYDSVAISTVGDLNYSFNAKDARGADATGVPTSDHVLSVLNAYKVRPTGGSGWYSTIASALSASPASSTVLVYPNPDFSAATYAGGLSNTNKTNRTLRSVCGAELTVISGGGTVYSLQGNDGAIIDGFTITGGTTYGIYSNADSLTVTNSRIHGNATGIHLNNGCNPVSIQNTTIYDNTSYGINSPSILNVISIASSNIYNNGGGATNGAGINLNGGAGTHTVSSSSLTGNTTTGNGGAIYCVNCAIAIDDSTINANTAGSGGALYFLNASVQAAITDTFIQGNQATGTLGGAIYMGNGAESLTNVMLTGNRAATNGGAVYVNGGTTTCLYCSISGNYAGGYGGALYQNSSTQTTIQNSVVYDNDAVSGGNYRQIYATSPRYTYVDVSYTMINQVPGANIFGPPDQRCSYENMGGNDISSNPNFVSPLSPVLAPTIAGDYRLQPGSPAVDAGSSSYPSDHDIVGGARPLGGGYDMGAHERE